MYSTYSMAAPARWRRQTCGQTVSYGPLKFCENMSTLKFFQNLDWKFSLNLGPQYDHSLLMTSDSETHAQAAGLSFLIENRIEIPSSLAISFMQICILYPLKICKIRKYASVNPVSCERGSSVLPCRAKRV